MEERSFAKSGAFILSSSMAVLLASTPLNNCILQSGFVEGLVANLAFDLGIDYPISDNHLYRNALHAE